ncbi:MAG: DUF1156 domain-containing protein [Euryarchaeota archaeon]|nr:DUF1156 domain-containing protein [Euryarchaeota archaeon]
MSEVETKYKKKLIEVAMPLETINAHSTTKGYHTGIHLWWARRPLATAKAVLLASLIDDPSNYLPDNEANKERKKLFNKITDILNDEGNFKIEKLIDKKEANSILVIDPFSGGGTISLAAQTLGLQSQGADLNPVATLIGKALVEFPVMYNGQKPINSQQQDKIFEKYNRAEGLANDVEYYGKKIFFELKNELREIYPRSHEGKDIFGIIWTRSVRCTNPACKKNAPLMNTLLLSKKKEIYLKPISINDNIEFNIVKKPTEQYKSIKVGRGSNFNCAFCPNSLSSDYIKNEGMNGKIRVIPVAIVMGTGKDRQYLKIDNVGKLNFDIPYNGELDLNLGYDPRAIWCTLYGLNKYRDLFTDRQLFVLFKFSEKIKATYSELVTICEQKHRNKDYAKTIILYLSFAFDRFLEYYNSLVRWRPDSENSESIFSRAGIPMIWNFIEINPFLDANSQTFFNQVQKVANIIRKLPANPNGLILNKDSSTDLGTLKGEILVSTDPPYYDNIGYSDVSDFFYVWLKINLKQIFPDLFGTLLTPKKEEIVAIPYRFNGDKQKAITHFTENLERSFKLIKEVASEKFPITVYYAFKQAENEKTEHSDNDLVFSSTGWETMLKGLVNSGLQITGTWPIRTETKGRAVSINTNALASSIIIVCRKRKENAPLSTRREFINILKKEFISAIKNLQDTGIAPVDMAQSAIGPGIAVFSKYSKVLEADGSPMSVRTALQIINQELDAYLTEQESEMDKETRFCVAWYEQFGWNDGSFGDANTLATAKGTAVNALENAGVVFAKGGKVRLLKRDELEENWDPTKDKKLTVWECIQHSVKKLEEEGESGSAEIIRKIGGLAESVKDLAYRLYSLCEKKGWAEDGLAYNSLISSWQSITDKAEFGERISEKRKKSIKDEAQKTLFDTEG